jgi:hypothetical protein
MPSRKVAVTAEKVAINAAWRDARRNTCRRRRRGQRSLARVRLHHGLGTIGADHRHSRQRTDCAKARINATNNVFGPGVRANATIGRALRLVLLNCLKYSPGVSDRATMGTPGKYTCCIAENEEDHPWQPWHVERGFRREDSTVTLVAASTMIQIWHYGDHERLLRSIGDAMSFLGSIAILGRTPGAVVAGSEHSAAPARERRAKTNLRAYRSAHRANHR